jgi:hypothetical protein
LDGHFDGSFAGRQRQRRANGKLQPDKGPLILIERCVVDLLGAAFGGSRLDKLGGRGVAVAEPAGHESEVLGRLLVGCPGRLDTFVIILDAVIGCVDLEGDPVADLLRLRDRRPHGGVGRSELPTPFATCEEVVRHEDSTSTTFAF